MKTFLNVTMVLLVNTVIAQSLPKAVEKSFKTQFPNSEITGWKDNNTYEPTTTDVYYPDDDMDGATAIPENNAPKQAKELGIKDPEAPTEFFIFYTKDGIDWTSKFLVDGTFVIAHGKVDELPDAVTKAIKKLFPSTSFKIVRDKQKVIVPSSEVPIFRVYIKPKGDKLHIVKVTSKGVVLSNSEK